MVKVLTAVKNYSTFPKERPEHDFGSIVCDGRKFFFIIDYYAPGLRDASEDPSDPAKTVRNLTIMLADEY